jgi:hypothetical protein
MPKLSATAEGVSDAFGFWLSQHPISVPEIIEQAISKTFEKWLDDNGEEIVAGQLERLELRLKRLESELTA